MKEYVLIAGAGLAAVGVYMLYAKHMAATNATPAAAGAAGGTTSSSPGVKYPFAVTQAPRADNNPALNNQPFAQKSPQGGGSIISASTVASATQGAISGVADAFKNLFSSSGATDSSASDNYSVISYDPATIDENSSLTADMYAYDDTSSNSDGYDMSSVA